MGECRGLDTRKPIRMLNSVLLGLEIQSSDVIDDSESASYGDVSSGSDQQENMVFADSSAANVDNVSTLSNFQPVVAISKNTELGQFLSRPTLVDTRTWSTSDSIGPLSGNFIYIWHSLLSDPVIKRKIENYAFMKATLCIKMLINGTKFHYGCLRASYEPLSEGYPKRFDWHPLVWG